MVITKMIPPILLHKETGGLGILKAGNELYSICCFLKEEGFKCKNIATDRSGTRLSNCFSENLNEFKKELSYKCYFIVFEKESLGGPQGRFYISAHGIALVSNLHFSGLKSPNSIRIKHFKMLTDTDLDMGIWGDETYFYKLMEQPNLRTVKIFIESIKALYEKINSAQKI